MFLHRAVHIVDTVRTIQKKELLIAMDVKHKRDALFGGECKLFACAKDHGIEHCGLCHDFPCDLFVNQYDPEHGQRSAFMRAGLLAYRKKYGTEKFVEISMKLDNHK